MEESLGRNEFGWREHEAGFAGVFVAPKASGCSKKQSQLAEDIDA